MTEKQTTILAILDGWGIGPKDETNAIWLAKTPVFDYLSKKYPFTQLERDRIGCRTRQSSNQRIGNGTHEHRRGTDRRAGFAKNFRKHQHGNFFSQSPPFWARSRMSKKTNPICI